MILILLLMLTITVNAQEVVDSRIDSKTVAIVETKAINVHDLKFEITQLENRNAMLAADITYNEAKIAALQAKLDAAADLGVEEAIPLKTK